MIVAGKDQGEVDNDYLLIPVNILDHEGPLGAAFPVENRLLPQSASQHHLLPLLHASMPARPCMHTGVIYACMHSDFVAGQWALKAINKLFSCILTAWCDLLAGLDLHVVLSSMQVQDGWGGRLIPLRLMRAS